MGTVYKLTFPDGKAYIGSTTIAVNKRLKQHEYMGRYYWPSDVGLAIKEHGIENVVTEILNEISDVKELRKKESELIIKHKTQYPYGHNKSLSNGPLKGSKY